MFCNKSFATFISQPPISEFLAVKRTSNLFTLNQVKKVAEKKNSWKMKYSSLSLELSVFLKNFNNNFFLTFLFLLEGSF